jgi:hypothetical protein
VAALEEAYQAKLMNTFEAPSIKKGASRGQLVVISGEAASGRAERP